MDKYLLRGTKIKLGDELRWVDFKYEQLPLFCFYCGRLGHSERLCELKMSDSKKEKISEGQYDEWVRTISIKG